MYAVAALCLVWVFHDVRVDQLTREVAGIGWGYALLGVLADVASYALQGVRWSRLLTGLGPCSSLRATQAIYVGLFANEVMPLRVGEAARAYLVGRWLRRPVAAVLPSMVVERLFDGLWLAAGVGSVALFIRLPRSIARGADVLGAVALGGTAAFLLLVATGSRRVGAARTSDPKGVLGGLSEGLRAIGTGRTFFVPLLLSGFVLLFQALSFWLVMVAYRIPLSFWAGAAVFLVVHLGTALPNAPSNVGSYQFFCVVGLTLLGVDKTTASGFSVVAFLVLTLPLWALGLLALTRTGLSLGDIRRREQRG